ncbi:MAG: hypothetical protein WCE94_02660 [Candidatus Methanoperedens sp.]
MLPALLTTSEPQCSLVLVPRGMAEAKRYEDEIPAIIKALLESEKEGSF